METTTTELTLQQHTTLRNVYANYLECCAEVKASMPAEEDDLTRGWQHSWNANDDKCADVLAYVLKTRKLTPKQSTLIGKTLFKVYGLRMEEILETRQTLQERNKDALFGILFGE